MDLDAIMIEKDVPFIGRRGKWIRLFQRLEPGDSFEVDADMATKVRASATNYARRNPGWTYSAQKQDDGSLRVWRIT